MSKKIEKTANAETSNPAAVEQEASTEGLVKMRKNGEHLHVHPATVDAHKSAGWELA